MLASTNAVTVSQMSNSLMALCQKCLGCLCMLEQAEVMVGLKILQPCGISIIEQVASNQLILILMIQK
jgi:hypothetical protein